MSADSGYGRSHAFRQWLEQRDQAYAVMIPKTTALQYEGRRERAEQLGARLPEEAWGTVPTSAEGQQASSHRWVCLPLSGLCPTGRRRWLLIRRRQEDPLVDLAYYLAYGPEAPPLARGGASVRPPVGHRGGLRGGQGRGGMRSG